MRDIRRATRKQYSAEEKIRIVLDGVRGDATIAELCRRERGEQTRHVLPYCLTALLPTPTTLLSADTRDPAPSPPIS